ncbi:MAG: hypothetical protein ACK5CA_08780 [Cyanobacteriota bacterium]|jgi:hypothetical protein
MEAINFLSLFKEPAGASEFDEAFQALADYETLSQLWNELTQIRNDIAYGGMNRDPKPAKTLQNRADSLLPRLREMAEVSLCGRLPCTQIPVKDSVLGLIPLNPP